MSLFSLFSIKLMNLHFLKKNLTFFKWKQTKNQESLTNHEISLGKCVDETTGEIIFEFFRHCSVTTIQNDCHVTVFFYTLLHTSNVGRNYLILFFAISSVTIKGLRIYRIFINAMFWNCYHETSESKQIEVKKFRAFELFENCNILSTK